VQNRVYFKRPTCPTIEILLRVGGGEGGGYFYKHYSCGAVTVLNTVARNRLAEVGYFTAIW
jgi:hypothetical protein